MKDTIYIPVYTINMATPMTPERGGFGELVRTGLDQDIAFDGWE
jgi:hypothetical protein